MSETFVKTLKVWHQNLPLLAAHMTRGFAVPQQLKVIVFIYHWVRQSIYLARICGPFFRDCNSFQLQTLLCNCLRIWLANCNCGLAIWKPLHYHANSKLGWEIWAVNCFMWVCLLIMLSGWIWWRRCCWRQWDRHIFWEEEHFGQWPCTKWYRCRSQSSWGNVGSNLVCLLRDCLSRFVV